MKRGVASRSEVDHPATHILERHMPGSLMGENHERPSALGLDPLIQTPLNIGIFVRPFESHKRPDFKRKRDQHLDTHSTPPIIFLTHLKHQIKFTDQLQI